eukprot:m.115140 g.115140  ORF g.115140 m.115140 type:complete len:284 (+) comp28400_c0_seq2:91-942(+)
MQAKIESLFVRPAPESAASYDVFSRKQVESTSFDNGGLTGSTEWHRSKRATDVHDEATLYDRAILCQCADSYVELSATFPKLKDHFMNIRTSGGFAENILLTGYTVDTVCIGDIYQLQRANGGKGDKSKFVVTCPRRPCTKVDTRHGKLLNKQQYTTEGVRHHTAVTGLAGFFIRPLLDSAGDSDNEMSSGDKFLRVSSPHPQWTLRYVADMVYGCHDKEYNITWTHSEEKLEEFVNLSNLAALEWKTLGLECQQKFKRARLYRTIGVIMVIALVAASIAYTR